MQFLVKSCLQQIQRTKSIQIMNITPKPFIYQFATFSEKLQQRQQAQASEEYKKEIDFLSNKPTFTLIDFRQRIVDGLHKIKKGLKYKLASGTEQTQQQLTQQKQILNAMFDEELLNPDKLNGEKKQEIAMVAQVQVSDVNQVIQHFKSMQNMHKWIREKKESGEKIPDNQEELLYRFRQDKPMSKAFLKFDWKRPKFSQKQRLQRMKWGNKKKL